jgi:hypothetical protein
MNRAHTFRAVVVGHFGMFDATAAASSVPRTQ